MRTSQYGAMRAMPFVLVGLVLLTAVACFVKAPGSISLAPDKATTSSASTAPAVAATATPDSGVTARASAAPAATAPAPPPANTVFAPVSVTNTPSVCVHRNDGATVCGPVAEGAKAPAASPFDQPGAARPLTPGPLIVAPRVGPKKPPHQQVRQVKHEVERKHEPERKTATARRAVNAPPPRDLQHPPQRVAREDVRRFPATHDRRPPPPDMRAPLPRYAVNDPRHRDGARPLPHGDKTSAIRDFKVDRYLQQQQPQTTRERSVQYANFERRVAALEHEIRVLRAQRDGALRRNERRDAGQLYNPPPAFREHDTRRDGGRNMIGRPFGPNGERRDGGPAQRYYPPPPPDYRERDTRRDIGRNTIGQAFGPTRYDRDRPLAND